MIIVAGKIYVAAEKRETFLSVSLDSVKQARQAIGCRDFAVSADLLEPDRVNIYEAWDSEDSLESFRGMGPDSEINSLIKDAEVTQYNVVEHAAS